MSLLNCAVCFVGVALTASTSIAQPLEAQAAPTFRLPQTGHICQGVPYPRAAAETNTQGTTRLQYEVQSSGEIEKVVVQQSSGSTREHKLLDVYARETLKSCRRPFAALPVAGTYHFEYVWRIAP